MRLVTALSHNVRWESGAAEARLFFRASALHFAPRLVQWAIITPRLPAG